MLKLLRPDLEKEKPEIQRKITKSTGKLQLRKSGMPRAAGSSDTFNSLPSVN